MQRELLGIIIVDFDATDQQLTINSAIFKYLRKKNGIKRSTASAAYRLQENL